MGPENDRIPRKFQRYRNVYVTTFCEMGLYCPQDRAGTDVQTHKNATKAPLTGNRSTKPPPAAPLGPSRFKQGWHAAKPHRCRRHRQYVYIRIETVMSSPRASSRKRPKPVPSTGAAAAGAEDPALPWVAAAADHAVTPDAAYEHVNPVLLALARALSTPQVRDLTWAHVRGWVAFHTTIACADCLVSSGRQLLCASGISEIDYPMPRRRHAACTTPSTATARARGGFGRSDGPPL